METLLSLQSWMQSAITGEAWDESVERAAESVLSPSPTLGPLARLAIHRTGYFLRLLGCLRASLPRLHAALGDALFDDFARDYLAHHPPDSPSLESLDRHFADHLEATRPDAGCDDKEAWIDFLVDLVRFDQATRACFHGDGPEGLPLLDRETLSALAAAASADASAPLLHLRPIPSLSRLPLRFPLLEHFATAPPPGAFPAPHPTSLLLHRRDFRVHHRALTEAEDRLLSALLRGRLPSDPATLDRLARWTDAGLLLAPPDERKTT